jgi:hypothetical protein
MAQNVYSIVQKISKILFMSNLCTEAEFMNVQVEVSGHNLEKCQTRSFLIQCLHYKPLLNHALLLNGVRLKSVCRGVCEQQGGKT